MTALTLAPSPAPDDLDQRVAADQTVTAGRAELGAGHVDIGPRYHDGEWTVLVHDDTVVPPVWRSPRDAVIRVPDAATQEVPDDPAYAFLEQEPGTPVHVIPQTQDPDVVWVGWNTQDPGVMDAVDRGVTMSLLGVQGPGDLTVFLQSGSLGAPDVLWSSRQPYPQPVWVETNTHTHANWVFARPGVYLATVEFTAELAGGGTVTAREVLRFAVGDRTTADAAFAAAFTEPLPSAAEAAAADPDADPPERGSHLLAIGVAAAAMVVAAGLVWVGWRGRRVRRRAEPDQHTTAGHDRHAS
jgi:surface-anchored protein